MGGDDVVCLRDLGEVLFCNEVRARSCLDGARLASGVSCGGGGVFARWRATGLNGTGDGARPKNASSSAITLEERRHTCGRLGRRRAFRRQAVVELVQELEVVAGGGGSLDVGVVEKVVVLLDGLARRSNVLDGEPVGFRTTVDVAARHRRRRRPWTLAGVAMLPLLAQREFFHSGSLWEDTDRKHCKTKINRASRFLKPRGTNITEAAQ